MAPLRSFSEGINKALCKLITRRIPVGKAEKLIQRILVGTSDTSIPFDSLCSLLIRMGFVERIRGDHHIFTASDVDEIINIQPIGSKAKPYQIKQIRNIFLKYKLGNKNV